MRDAKYEALLKPILELYNQIETDLLLSVATRFDTYETIGGTLDWYMKKLQDMGAFTQANLDIIAKRSGIAREEIEKMLKDVGYDTMLSNGEMNLSTLLNSVANQDIIDSIIGNLENDIKIINTIALENTKKSYMDVLTQAYIETSSGTYSYNESIKRAIMKMANNGIAGASYKRANGTIVRHSIESSVRRDVLTRSHQLSVEVQMQNMKELDHNLVYVSQHLGARTHDTNPIADHAGWQGKVYMVEGSSDKYPNLVEATGYGDILGLAGVNCRHNISSYIEGVTVIPDPIDEAENERVYKLAQQQRALERDVRGVKKELAVGKTLQDPELVKKYKEKLKDRTDKLNNFVEANPELKRDYSRTQVTEEYKKGYITPSDRVASNVKKEYDNLVQARSIRADKQMQHIRGEKYVEGKSYFYGSYEDVEKLISNNIDKAEQIFTRGGKPTSKYRARSSSPVGVYKSQGGEISYETENFIIVKSSKGVHAYPAQKEK